jgi:Cellulase (glycosyl hydrolase family 5)
VADALGMRSPITIIAAALAALLCAVPALAGKPKRTASTTTTTSTTAVTTTTAPATPTVTGTVPLRTDGRLPIGFNEDYSLTRIWADYATATPWVNADADASAAAGATVSRTPLYWRGVQPTQGAWNWGAYDRIIGAYAARGMRPIVNVSGTPDWAKNCGTGCVFNTANLADFTTFIRALAERYGTELAGIEVYNEPNSAKYWGAPADPALYTKLLCAGYQGAQQAGVRLPIAGGALAPIQKTINGDIRMDWFLNSMYIDGAANCMDVVSFHPYPFSTDVTSSTSLFQTEFAQIRKTRDYYAPNQRLWVTETGIGLATSGVTQDQQAATLPAIYDTIAAMPQHDVDVVVFHTLVQSSGTLGYGLGQLVPGAGGDPLFLPTPAYVALRRKISGLSRRPSPNPGRRWTAVLACARWTLC